MKSTLKKPIQKRKHEYRRLNPDSLAQWHEFMKKNDALLDESVATVEKFIERYPLHSNDLCTVPYTVFQPGVSKVTFLKSVFQGRAPTAFFHYPNYVGEKRSSERTNIYNGEALEHLFMSYAYTAGTDYYNSVISSCKTAGFSEAEFTNQYFNILFTSHTNTVDWSNLNKYQKVSQFPNSAEIGSQHQLAKRLQKLEEKHPGEYQITPRTFQLPKESDQFEKARKKDPDQLWIIKPASSQNKKQTKIIDNSA